MPYRVVYGETMPSWEKVFETKRDATAFAKNHVAMGDMIFSIKKTVDGEPARSLMSAIAADDVKGFTKRFGDEFGLRR